MTGAAFRGAEGRTEKLKAAVPAERGAEFLARLVLLFGYEAPAVSGTPAAFRAGAAKPRLFLRFGEAETQGVRAAARVSEVGESAVGGLNFCDRGGVSRGRRGERCKQKPPLCQSHTRRLSIPLQFFSLRLTPQSAHSTFGCARGAELRLAQFSVCGGKPPQIQPPSAG